MANPDFSTITVLAEYDKPILDVLHDPDLARANC